LDCSKNRLRKNKIITSGLSKKSYSIFQIYSIYPQTRKLFQTFVCKTPNLKVDLIVPKLLKTFSKAQN
jgi:hypothetical protein